MKVTFYGIGYVGLVQAAVLADSGHKVCCVDIDSQKIKNLKDGIIPIYEPELEELVKNNYEAGRLTFTTDASIGVAFAQLQFIAVGTPPDEDGSADLKYVLAVAETIAKKMLTPKIIINKSTVPVGTAEKVYKKVNEVLQERKKLLEVSVVSNPEFLKEGAAVNDCEKPDRIIIGTDSLEAEKLMRELYAPFNQENDKIILMDIKSAELTKYAANCMLATKISFMNEMANIAELVGADIKNVREGIGSDSRIGFQFINPGCGYGGSCFPKDVQALIRTADDAHYNSKILKAVESVNYRQKNKLFSYISQFFDLEKDKETLKGKAFAVWGLSFKPGTDDMREAASRVLIESLLTAGAKVQAFDPKAMKEAQRIYGNRTGFKLVDTQELALKGANALVICTEWRSFRAVDLKMIESELKEAVIFDGRNLFEPDLVEKYKIHYFAVGRGLSVVK